MISIVTGATGCLGLSVTKRLLTEGHEVIALGRNQQLGQLITHMGTQFVPLDLQDKDSLKKICRNADLIFHCAALSSPWGPYADFYNANVLGTKHVIEATPEHARLIHVSSPSIYFDFTEKHQIKENAPLPIKPANNYIKTKRLAERLIDKAFSENKVSAVTIRPRAIFGPYDRSILPRLLKAEKKGILPIIGRGENLVDITYVDNVSDALLSAATADTHVLGKKYNITNDDPRTLNSILVSLFHALGKPLQLKHIPYALAKVIAFGLECIHQLGIVRGEPRLTQYIAGVLALGQTLNIDEAKQDLNYKPQVSIEQGIEQFANWYLPS
jgi:nucleoside-diphosphate-sugar epimerase